MNLLKKYKREIEYCTFCPRLCRFVCPVALAEDNETYTPTSKMTLVYLTEIASVKPEKVKEAFYMCVDCRHCITPCIHKIDVPKVLNSARAKIYESGLADGNINKFSVMLEKYGHPYGNALEQNLNDIVKNVSVKHGKVLYFPGCTSVRFNKDFVKGVIKLLDALCIEADVMDKPVCCGYPGYAAGNMNWFRKTAIKLKTILDKYDTVISTCPTCISTFRYLYHRYDIDIEAKPVHLLEYAAPTIKPMLRGLKKENKVVAYHDPCHLGRYLGVYDIPREIIDLLYQKRVEFQWNRDDANCCGGGGVVPLTHPKTSKKISDKRINEFKQTGAGLLLTACPSCVRRLKKPNDNVEVLDITEVLIKKLVEI